MSFPNVALKETGGPSSWGDLGARLSHGMVILPNLAVEPNKVINSVWRTCFNFPCSEACQGHRGLYPER